MSNNIDPTGQLRVEDITAYIRKTGWTKLDHPNPSLLVYQYKRNDDYNHEIKLVLPNGSDYTDAVAKIQSAAKLIAALEQTAVSDIVQKIKNRSLDIFRQRIYSSTRLTSLPLELAPLVISRLRDLVYYAACAEEDNQPYFAKGRKIGKEYTHKCRFGHTFQGSFGLTIEMPLPPSTLTLLPDIEASPLERRVMERIVRGLQFAVKGVRESDIGIMTSNYEQGFNANLCEVMKELTEDLDDFNLEYSMLWSPEFNASTDVSSFSNIIIEPSVFRPYFEAAAKSLRAVTESQETEIIGKIIQLKAESLDSDDDSGDSDGRQVIIAWDIGNNRKVNIKISLSPENYRTACDAHKDNKTVSVKGRPEKVGKSWVLTSPASFAINETGA